MTLQLVYGLASSDHLKQMAKLAVSLKEDYIVNYIVPPQISFESDVKFLEEIKNISDKEGSYFSESRIRTLTFDRLAWLLLRNDSNYQKPRLSSSSENMILYEIIQENNDKLILFNNIENRIGLLTSIQDQLNSFRLGNILSEDLDNIVSSLSEDQSVSTYLVSKLKDLNLIYVKYEEKIQTNWIDGGSILKLLSNNFKKENLANQVFIISAFNMLTGDQIDLVKSIMLSGGHVIFDFIADKRIRLNEDFNFFSENIHLAEKLENFAKENLIKIKKETVLKDTRLSKDLKNLENYFLNSFSGAKPTHITKYSDNCISVTEYSNKYLELELTLGKIRRQIISNPTLTYKDFAILIPDIGYYESILDPLFNKIEIPYFLDRKISMKKHVLVKFFKSLFEVKKYNYRSDDIIKLLKLGFISPSEVSMEYFLDSVSITENYVLKEGINGKDWLEDKKWYYDEFEDKSNHHDMKINLVKTFINNDLYEFYTKLDEISSGEKAVNIIYNFLLKYHVDRKIIEIKDILIEQGQISLGKEYEQAWNYLIKMLDEYLDILGKKDFNLLTFIDILNAGFESASFSQIPSTIDQVLVSEVNRIHISNYKIVYILGANDQDLPKIQNKEQILLEDDQRKIKNVLDVDKFIYGNYNQRQNIEILSMYLSFFVGTNELHFSYSIHGEDGKKNKLSNYVDRIVAEFNIKINKFSDDSVGDRSLIENYISSPRDTLSFLIKKLQLNKKIDDSRDLWLPVYYWMLNEHLKDLTNTLISSFNYQNTPLKLKSEIVEGLYGQSLDLSVSKLEDFFKNEYEYFLKYGLKLKERQILNLDVAKKGVYVHSFLDKAVKNLKNSIDDKENLNIQKFLNEIELELNNDFEFNVLNKSYRFKFFKNEMKTSVGYLFKTMVDQIENNIVPLVSEKTFGFDDKNSFPSVTVNLDQDRFVNLRGKIDRLDKARIEGRNFIEVVDYKTNGKKINFSNIYNGTELQLLIYLDVVKRNLVKGNNRLGGAFYLRIGRDMEYKKGRVNSISDVDGIMTENSIVNLGNNSDYFPIHFNKNGSIDKKSLNKIWQDKDLNLLINYVEDKVREAGNKIYNGSVSLNPVKWSDEKTALKYSPYKDIMQFDAMLFENKYRTISNLSKSEFITLLKEGIKND